MANGKIRGITIDIGADVSGLQKSLTNVNSSISNTQKQLKDVEKLLKLDPTNTELLNQKQKLLNKSVEEYSEKLKTLKSEQEKFAEAAANGNEAAQQSYDALQREIISTQEYLDDAKKSANNFGVVASKMSTAMQNVSDKAEAVAQATSKASKAAQGMLAGAAAIGAKIVSNYAEYEQLIGGIETLFEDGTDEVVKNAQAAYKTAGLSASEYMDTIMGFSASLNQALEANEGSTARAAELSNQIIVDMADNANKMGTSMESIQNAYQGFAKQNYTMLDNLKLGYGGTKEEMERLLEDAELLTGKEYDVSNFADIAEAIHAIQTEIGITGTTAAEAEGTISGSLSTFKAALDNLLTMTGTANADIDTLTQNVIDAGTAVVDNILPVIQNIIGNLPEWVQVLGIITGIVAVISPIAGLISNITGAISGFMMVWPGIAGAISSVLAFVAANPITLIAAAIAALAVIIVENWDKIKPVLENIKERVLELVDTIKTRIKTNINMILGFVNKAIEAINKLINGVNSIGSSIGIGAKIPTISSIPLLAKGGTLSSGSAIVGEAGAELLTVNRGKATVTPLTNNTTYNTYNQTSREPVQLSISLDGQEFARAIYDPMQSETLRRGVSLIGV